MSVESSDIESIDINKINLQIDDEKRQVGVLFPISTGIGEITFKTIGKDKYEYKVDLGGEPVRFPANKPLSKIGNNNNCILFKRLNNAFEAKGIYPNFGGSDTKENVDLLIQEIQFADYYINKPFKKWDEKKKEVKKSFAQATGFVDKFDSEIQLKAKDILETENFLKFAVDVIGHRAVAQKEKITLSTLVALSSLIPKPIGSLAIASPGKGKSRVSETVYEIFPKQRRLEFNTESTVAGIVNLTKFAEGNEILKGKLIYLGDLGSKKEQENPKVRDLLSMFKILQTRQQYSKVLTDMQSEDGTATVLTLNGCGSIMVETTAKKVEAQFDDRAFKWSPDDNQYVNDTIDNYQTEDIARIKKNHYFKQNRPVVACAIEMLYRELESVKKDGYTFEILSPYGQHIFDLFPTDVPSVTRRDKEHLLEMPKLVTLTNLMQRQVYTNKELKIVALVVEPEDYLFVLREIGKPMAYMLSPVPENILSYLDLIEKEYVEGSDWPYTYSEYNIGFHNGFENHEAQEAFDNFVRDAKPIYVDDVAKIMGVENKIARDYLNDLTNEEILFRGKEGTYNVYYPVEDFKEKKDSFGVKFIPSEELEPGTDINKEIYDIYDEFIDKLDSEGFKK